MIEKINNTDTRKNTSEGSPRVFDPARQKAKFEQEATSSTSNEHGKSDEHRGHTKAIENLDAHYESTKKEFLEEYKDKLSELPNYLHNVQEIFEESRKETGNLQETADRLYERFIDIKRLGIKKELIQLTITKRVEEAILYRAASQKFPLELRKKIGIDNPGELTRIAISNYLEEKGLKPSDFDDIWDILAKPGEYTFSQSMHKGLKESLLEALSQKKVIDSQIQVFDSMTHAHKKGEEELEYIREKLGDLDPFLEKAGYHYIGQYINGEESNIIPVYEFHLENDYEKIDYSTSKENFFSAIKRNWEKFENNYRHINDKVYYSQHSIEDIYDAFKT